MKKRIQGIRNYRTYIAVIGFSFITCGGDDDNGNNPLIRVSGEKGFSISLPVWVGKFAS
jgi:hypothetical protein